MSAPSNSYADKIYSEHPIALWALDEEFANDLTFDPPYQLDKATNIKNVIYLYTGQKAVKYGSSDPNVDCGYYTYSPSPGYADGPNSSILASGLYSNVENAGIPLVYGASNISELYKAYFSIANGMISDEHNNPLYIPHPSLLIPGKGFLNKDGQYRDMTLEFWMRMDSSQTLVSRPGQLDRAFRFMGPVASDDGLYVANQTIILKVGNFIGSHFVGDLDRPILIHIVLQKNGANLMVNGEVVVKLSYDRSVQQDFPTKYGQYNKEQDWLGFFVELTTKFSVDCIAIYPKALNTTIAKKHFAYGQAVEFPQQIISKHGGQSFNADYSVANYAANVTYPGIEKWESGISNNLERVGSSLSIPNYSLPEFFFYKNGTRVDVSTAIQDTMSVIGLTMPTALCFEPTTDYSSSYAKFDSLPIGPGKKMSAFYVKMDLKHYRSNNEQNTQTVLKIFDKVSRNSFNIISSILNNTVTVSAGFTSALGVYSKIYSRAIDISGNATTEFFGLNIDRYAEIFGNTFLNTNQSSLVIYLGGEENGKNSFTGAIHNFSIVDSNNLQLNQKNPKPYEPNNKIDDPLFGTDGFIADNHKYGNGETISSVVGKPTYGLVFRNIGNYRYPDIQIAGYWHDEIPFSRLSKNIDGQYRFDFVQINNGMNISFNSSSWAGQIVGDRVNTQSNPIKMFAKISTESQRNSIWWTGLGQADITGVMTKDILDVDGNVIGKELTDSSEILNNTIIFPKVTYLNQDVFANQVLALAVEFFVDGIIATPIAIKSLQVASQSNTATTKIGSRFGGKLKPYQTDPSTINAYRIYKDSTPHAYLTNNTGISLSGDFDSQKPRGLALNINESSADDFYVSSLQFAYFYDRYSVASGGINILEINTQTTGYEKIRLKVSESPETPHDGRPKELVLSCFNVINGQEIDITSSVQFYIDGHKQTSPMLEPREWSVIGLQFEYPLNCSGSKDYSVNIIGPGLFNNIVYLRIPRQDFYNKATITTWTSALGSSNWQSELSKTWEQLLFISVPAENAVPLDYLFNLYLGTNKVVIDPDATSELVLSSQPYSIYKNTSWSSQTIQPV